MDIPLDIKSFHVLYLFLGVIAPDSSSLSAVVSEAFVRFFVEMVGHYSLFMGGSERDDESLSSPASSSPTCPSPSSFQREAFRKAVTSKSLRRFLEVFMETQMFSGFIQERELRRQGLKGTETWSFNTALQNNSFSSTFFRFCHVTTNKISVCLFGFYLTNQWKEENNCEAKLKQHMGINIFFFFK